MFNKLTPDYIHTDFTRYDWVDIQTNFLWFRFINVPGLPIIKSGFAAEVESCMVIVGFLYTLEPIMFVFDSKTNRVHSYRLRTNMLYLKIFNLVNTKFSKVPLDIQRINLNNVVENLNKDVLCKIDRNYLTPMLTKFLHVVPDYPELYVITPFDDNFCIILGENDSKNFIAIFDKLSKFYTIIYDTDVYKDIFNNTDEVATPNNCVIEVNGEIVRKDKSDKYSYTLDELSELISSFYTYGTEQNILPIFIGDEFKRLVACSNNMDLMELAKSLKKLSKGENK